MCVCVCVWVAIHHVVGTTFCFRSMRENCCIVGTGKESGPHDFNTVNVLLLSLNILKASVQNSSHRNETTTFNLFYSILTVFMLYL